MHLWTICQPQTEYYKFALQFKNAVELELRTIARAGKHPEMMLDSFGDPHTPWIPEIWTDENTNARKRGDRHVQQICENENYRFGGTCRVDADPVAPVCAAVGQRKRLPVSLKSFC